MLPTIPDDPLAGLAERPQHLTQRSSPERTGGERFVDGDNWLAAFAIRGMKSQAALDGDPEGAEIGRRHHAERRGRVDRRPPHDSDAPVVTTSPQGKFLCRRDGAHARHRFQRWQHCEDRAASLVGSEPRRHGRIYDGDAVGVQARIDSAKVRDAADEQPRICDEQYASAICATTVTFEAAATAAHSAGPSRRSIVAGAAAPRTTQDDATSRA